MAWRCSGKSNTALIENLYRADIITSNVVRSAMSLTDRQFYVGKFNSNLAYEDRPLSIGFNATISAPHMHAYALENLLSPLKNAADAGRVPRVLDVGCGSGYLLGAFARCYGAHVTGLEHIKDLYDLSVRNFASDVKNSEDGESIKERVEIHHCDGRLGWPSDSTEESYDVIHVGAAAPEIPKAFFAQLNRGGRLILPVGPKGGSQIFQQWDKDAQGELTHHNLMGVIYIPLTDVEAQLNDSD